VGLANSGPGRTLEEVRGRGFRRIGRRGWTPDRSRLQNRLEALLEEMRIPLSSLGIDLNGGERATQAASHGVGREGGRAMGAARTDPHRGATPGE
jgi:hypothetical protein